MAKAKKAETTDLGTLDMSDIAMRLEAPTGQPPRAWTEEEKENLKAAMANIATREEGAIRFWQRRGKDIPEYATEWSAGFDLKADLEVGDLVDFYNHANVKGNKSVRGDSNSTARLYLEPGDRALIPTGLHADIPQHFYIAIHPRSGTSWKQALFLTNSVGVVDADYVEEIKVSITNMSGTRIVIEDGDRIAQGLLMPVARPTAMIRINEKPAQKTSRAGGFGSTGVK